VKTNCKYKNINDNTHPDNMHLKLTHTRIIKWLYHMTQGKAVYCRLQLSILFMTVVTLLCVNIDNAHAITQFYFEIPSEIENTTGTIFLVDTANEVFSWRDNGTDIIPANNNTPNIQADDTGMDLDANEYLLAVEDNLDIGTHVYMCVSLTNYSTTLTEPICETDAIDNDRLARAALQFPSEQKVNSNPD
jgi:hypothetical protein